MKFKSILLFVLIISINLSAKLTAVVSIEPQVTFLKQIAKDKINIELMVKNGASIHNYSPKPSQMKNITKARLYFAIGVEFENIWINKFKQINKNMTIIHTDKNIKKLTMIEHHHNDEISNDPHIWTSPTNVKIIVKNMLNALIIYDKGNKSFYINNYNKFINKIDNTNNKIKNILKQIPSKTKFMVFHPSWGYFAKEYNLKEIALEKEGKEPGLKYVMRLINTAKEKNIKIILTSPEFSQKSAKFIANKIGGKVISFSPLKYNIFENLLEVSKILNEYSRN